MSVYCGMKKPTNKIYQFLKTFGPGVITGAADDDPSGIATYTQTMLASAINMFYTLARG